MRRDLLRLVSQGLGARARFYRWEVTEDGFGFAGLPIVAPKKVAPPVTRPKPARTKREKALERLRRQVAAHKVYDSLETVD